MSYATPDIYRKIFALTEENTRLKNEVDCLHRLLAKHMRNENLLEIEVENHRRNDIAARLRGWGPA